MSTEYKIPQVAADIVMEIMEGLCLKSDMNVDQAANYINKSKKYAKRALIVAEQLRMIPSADSNLNVVGEAKVITRANKEQWPVIFRKFLQRYNPFILFVSLLAKGNTLEDATRKIKVIYDIDSNPSIIKTSLVRWGEYSEILKKEEDKIKLFIKTDELSVEYIKELLESMENDVKARIYIANKLGEDVFGYMKQDEVDLLIKAIREHNSDAKISIDVAGQAFEDFLRRLATDKAINAGSCTGIQQLADSILHKKLITSKHHEICKAINSFRIAAGHNKDKKSLQKWELNPDAAIECILLSLTTIRSIHNYVFKQIQMF